MSQIPPMETLDCEGEPASIGLRWEKWKRGLELYLTATNVTTPEAKKATLLHMGGLPLQEIYYNIPETVTEGIDVYTVAVQKTRTIKRKIDHPPPTTNATKKFKGKPKHEEVDYIFHLDGDESIICSIGEVDVEMLIDSGSKCNIINDVTWELLKSKGIRVNNQVKNPDKIFMAYGSQHPLIVLGCFDSSINVGNGSKLDKQTFYVVKSGTKNLLGKDTATKLGVLRVGLKVNAIEGTFPKIKGV
ncbi:hypothetical protein ACJJTC_015381 [Scirpophaga incertulas]